MHQKQLNDVPVFGPRVTGAQYVVRPCAYAVIKNDRELVAVVETRLGMFLPGGGVDEGETAEDAVCREVLEECGLRIKPGSRIAEAIQLAYSSAEKAHFEKSGIFLSAVIAGPETSSAELDHRLLWIAPGTAPDLMAHASHAWVLRGHAA